MTNFSFTTVLKERISLNTPLEWKQRYLIHLGEIPEVVDAIVAAMQTRQYPSKDLFAVRLAVEEGLANAIKHGNRCQPGKRVILRYCLNPDCVVVEIEDEGDGFDPSQVPDPLLEDNLDRPTGRGLLLMQGYCTWLFHNDRGNCVTLIRARSTREDRNGTS